MGAKTMISAEEYLRTAYEGPEPDFVDGEIVSRAMPNSFHSRAIRFLIALFLRQAAESLFPYPELRIRVNAEKYRIADLAVFERELDEEVPEATPLIVMEVLSPDDSYSELMAKFADYASLGVSHVWLVDPVTKRFSVYHDGSLTATPQLEVSAHDVVLRLGDIFPA
jgi:Uma2 family endonuclease